MKPKKLTQHDTELLQRAKQLATKRKPSLTRRKSEPSRVATVIETTTGKIFEGVNIEVSCAPCSICAEYAAVAQMVTAGEKRIKTVATVGFEGSRLKAFSPCGMCRQFLSYFGNPYVIVPIGRGVHKVKLCELLPAAYK